MGYSRSGNEFFVSSGGSGGRGQQASTSLANGTIAVAFNGPDADQLGIFVRLIGTNGKPVGVDIPINQTTTDFQITPAIVSLSGGGFAVVWNAPDADGYGLFARIFNAAGVATTDEFRVNSNQTGSQVEPHLVALNGGGFQVQFRSGESGSNDIVAQSVSALGALVGAAQQVAPSVSAFGGNGIEPVIRINNDTMISTWSDSGAGFALKIQRFSTNGDKIGTAITIDTLRVNPPGVFTPNQEIIALADGRALLTWREMVRIDTTYHSEIRGQLLDGQGLPVGGPIDLRPYSPGQTINLTPVALANGGFVVLYAELVNGANQLMSRVFSGAGIPEGAAVSLGPIGFGSVPVYDLHSVRTPAGENVLFWSENDGTSVRLVGSVLDAAGHQVGQPFAVSSTATTGTDASADAYMLSDGSILVVWNSTGSSSADAHIAAQIVRSSATSPSNTFYGAPGNQTYDGGSGIDTVSYAAASGALTVDLSLTGFQSVGGGFGSDKLISIENLRGGSGDDSLSGNAVANMISGGAGNDTLLGRGGVDNLRGDAGNDTLDGGTGADRLFGGAGNDTYIVDSSGDLVREDTVAGVDDGGIDLVMSSVTHTLRTFVENLTLTGSAAIDGTGNALANTISGNNAVNRLYGLDGNDTLNGFGGNDVLRGGDGDDTLDGGAGADNMDGQNGSDTYRVDSSDYVRDTGTSGTDTVVASSSFTLKTGNGIENIRLTTGGTGNLTGNELGNAITAYGGDNVLMGLGGNDTIRAGTGNDTIRGGLGSDKLYGEAGADTFVFKTGESLAATGVNGADVIMDFTTGSDHIDLAIFGGTPATSAYAEVKVNSDSFAVLKSAAEAAMTGSQRVVFVAGTSHGWLFWSSNGPDGTVEEAVQLSGRNTLAGFDRADII